MTSRQRSGLVGMPWISTGGDPSPCSAHLDPPYGDVLDGRVLRLHGTRGAYVRLGSLRAVDRKAIMHALSFKWMIYVGNRCDGANLLRLRDGP
jgi:hypothetical protein